MGPDQLARCDREPNLAAAGMASIIAATRRRWQRWRAVKVQRDDQTLTKMRWFGGFLAAKKNDEQTTGSNDQNAADQN